MSEIKLLPCPFCGSEAKLHHNLLTDKFKVWCSECDCRTDIYSDKEEAIKCWNTRKPMERIINRLVATAIGGIMRQPFVTLKKALSIVQEEGGIDGIHHN